jgi:hypothetical protein
MSYIPLQSLPQRFRILPFNINRLRSILQSIAIASRILRGTNLAHGNTQRAFQTYAISILRSTKPRIFRTYWEQAGATPLRLDLPVYNRAEDECGLGELALGTWLKRLVFVARIDHASKPNTSALAQTAGSFPRVDTCTSNCGLRLAWRRNERRISA